MTSEGCWMNSSARREQALGPSTRVDTGTLCMFGNVCAQVCARLAQKKEALAHRVGTRGVEVFGGSSW